MASSHRFSQLPMREFLWRTRKMAGSFACFSAAIKNSSFDLASRCFLLHVLYPSKA
ncbi:hypothetical protein PAXINDRAFT_167033 [Paxillus involutus ATCC 200175]|nr:hypothetical protein PAXINDRAFT_167033 [Paxillus involutus ATCC 200175]